MLKFINNLQKIICGAQIKALYYSIKEILYNIYKSLFNFNFCKWLVFLWIYILNFNITHYEVLINIDLKAN